MSAAEVSARLELIAELPIFPDDQTTDRALRETLALVRAQRLTTYDASYLELAMRRALPLATKDEDLRQAADRNGVELLL